MEQNRLENDPVEVTREVVEIEGDRKLYNYKFVLKDQPNPNVEKSEEQ